MHTHLQSRSPSRRGTSHDSFMVAEDHVDASASISASCAARKPHSHPKVSFNKLISSAKGKLHSTKKRWYKSLRKIIPTCCGPPAVNEHDADVHSPELHTPPVAQQRARTSSKQDETKNSNPITYSIPSVVDVKVPKAKHGFTRSACRRTRIQLVLTPPESCTTHSHQTAVLARATRGGKKGRHISKPIERARRHPLVKGFVLFDRVYSGSDPALFARDHRRKTPRVSTRLKRCFARLRHRARRCFQAVSALGRSFIFKIKAIKSNIAFDPFLDKVISTVVSLRPSRFSSSSTRPPGKWSPNLCAPFFGRPHPQVTMPEADPQMQMINQQLQVAWHDRVEKIPKLASIVDPAIVQTWVIRLQRLLFPDTANHKNGAPSKPGTRTRGTA